MMLLLMLTAAAADGEKQTEGRRRLQAAPPWWQLHHHFHFVRLSSSDWSSKSRIGLYFEPACLYISSQPVCSSSELRRLRASLAARAATFEDFQPACLLGHRPSKPTTEQLRASPSINMAAQYQHGSDTFSFVASLGLDCAYWTIVINSCIAVETWKVWCWCVIFQAQRLYEAR